MQYFFLKGMNDTFKSQLIQITNHNKPAVDEITKHFFDANERYQSVKSSKTKKVSVDSNVSSKPGDSKVGKTSTLANNMNVKSNPFKSCTICSDVTSAANHSISKCTKYKSVSDKVKKLQQLNGCVKCASITHETKNCSFRFSKRCFHYNGWHLSFLCTFDSKLQASKVNDLQPSSKSLNSKSSTDPKAKEKGSEKTKTGLVLLGATWQSNDSINSIFPTFTCEFAASGKMIRGLRDNGSQSNFISEAALTDQTYRVINNNFVVSVNGFNGTMTYRTKLVELQLKFGEDCQVIEAICLPKININLHLPGLSVIIQRFVDKGYVLADKCLLDNLDKIGDIGLILSTNSSHCVMVNSVKFGTDSTYMNTPLGVILEGNVNRMLNNLDNLPVCVGDQVFEFSCSIGHLQI